MTESVLTPAKSPVRAPRALERTPRRAPSAGRPQRLRRRAARPVKPPVKRQIVCFTFYKVMPEWRRLPAGEKAAHHEASPMSSPDGTSLASSFAHLFDRRHARRCRHVHLVIGYAV